ncbi:hypothetical protein HAV22_21545 [Massilia sp. TW-1]|uniref:Uncharacterized protein n=1 Tax=Telluria antibiotica TaxID=2717319 RepID=A0ABX0PIH9_9BURK|nr:hypothetical protein [Telluria antibiotica]NIA56218.1 hypothetical protein [Telluria antibiotica]
MAVHAALPGQLPIDADIQQARVADACAGRSGVTGGLGRACAGSAMTAARGSRR